MPNILDGKEIVLGVSGSIACYKAVDLASKLTQASAHVDVVLTKSAQEFLSPITFASITHRSVVTNLFEPQSEISIDHVALAERADIIVVAPATANTIAKMAWGMADNALTTTILATKAPIVVAPAMDAHMYDNTATQENLQRLRSRGVTIAGPASGRLASGLVGKGRMLETAELIGYVRQVLGQNGDLAGRTIVVSAGGTREPIDPVRVITNRSSGKMGYAIAEVARDRGSQVILVTAPTSLADPVGVQVVHVETALEMRNAIFDAVKEADALIMAAAVADYRPASQASQKVKKEAATWSVELTKNPDILAEATGRNLVKVGFAAESENLVANARKKLQAKGAHLFVANDITSESSGFNVDTNQVTILDRDGIAEELSLMSKSDVAHHILDRVVKLLR